MPGVTHDIASEELKSNEVILMPVELGLFKAYKAVGRFLPKFTEVS